MFLKADNNQPTKLDLFYQRTSSVLEGILSLLKADELMILPTKREALSLRNQLYQWCSYNDNSDTSLTLSWSSVETYFAKSINMMTDNGLIIAHQADSLTGFNLNKRVKAILLVKMNPDYWTEDKIEPTKKEAENFIEKMRECRFIITERGETKMFEKNSNPVSEEIITEVERNIEKIVEEKLPATEHIKQELEEIGGRIEEAITTVEKQTSKDSKTISQIVEEKFAETDTATKPEKPLDESLSLTEAMLAYCRDAAAESVVVSIQVAALPEKIEQIFHKVLDSREKEMAEKEELSKKVDKLTGEIIEITDDYKEKIDSKDKRIYDLENNLKDLRESYNLLSEDHKKLFDKKDKTISDLENNYNVLKEAYNLLYADHKSSVEKYKKEVDELTKKLESSKMMTDDLTNQMTILSNELENKINEISSLKEANNQLRKEISISEEIIEQKIAEKDATIGRLETKLTNLTEARFSEKELDLARNRVVEKKMKERGI